MNKVFNVGLVIVVVSVCVATYLYFNPQHLPTVFRRSAPGFEVPAAKSPVSNFRPPAF